MGAVFFMSARILTSSSGSVTRFHEADGKVAIETIVDVQPALDLAHTFRTVGDHYTPMGDKFLGFVPVEVLAKWARARGVTYARLIGDRELMKRFMNDPENSKFRVAGGRV